MQSITREVLEAARTGDRNAFELIVRTHFRVAYVVALATVRDPATAEDVVQDSFVRSWQRLGQCKDPAAFSAWLRSIVRSVALNHIEREAVRATSSLADLDVPGDSSPERDLEGALLRERLMSAMEGLTDLQREILLLYDLEGFRHLEIARLLGISDLMSRKHLSNARKRMRRALTTDSRGRASR
jgi:RNA polymerase sigma-70 factor (ECF subfamily)